MALTVGESDHNGSAVALARRSSYLCNNNSPEWLPRNIRATQSLSLNTVLRNTKPVSLDATLADVGRRDGLGHGVRPAVTDDTFGWASLRGQFGHCPSRGDVDHRPVGRGWGTETASTGSSLA